MESQPGEKDGQNFTVYVLWVKLVEENSGQGQPTTSVVTTLPGQMKTKVMQCETDLSKLDTATPLARVR